MLSDEMVREVIASKNQMAFYILLVCFALIVSALIVALVHGKESKGSSGKFDITKLTLEFKASGISTAFIFAVGMCILTYNSITPEIKVVEGVDGTKTFTIAQDDSKSTGIKWSKTAKMENPNSPKLKYLALTTNLSKSEMILVDLEKKTVQKVNIRDEVYLENLSGVKWTKLEDIFGSRRAADLESFKNFDIKNSKAIYVRPHDSSFYEGLKNSEKVMENIEFTSSDDLREILKVIDKKLE